MKGRDASFLLQLRICIQHLEVTFEVSAASLHQSEAASPEGIGCIAISQTSMTSDEMEGGELHLIAE